MLYHSGPTFGQVLYSCQDAFVVDASDYSGHLIRHLLNTSEAFPTEWFLQCWEQVKGWWVHVRTVQRVGKHLPSILFQNFRYCTWGMRPRVWSLVTARDLTPVSFVFHFKAPFCTTGTTYLPIRTHCSLLKSGSQLSRNSERLHHPTGRARAVCRTFEMTKAMDLTCQKTVEPMKPSDDKAVSDLQTPHMKVMTHLDSLRRRGRRKKSKWGRS